ncbi:MAG: PLP-dependent aminotransferase family protein [Acetobacteraceae bacterium]|nr:PLP-dependent aminotransferase family protein [Acetobacteraceae bacterium]
MFAIDRQSAVPLFRQLYGRVRGAISAGRLRPGDRLPSARSLAAQIGAARGTVEAAYAMLAGEGWIIARGAAGTVVAACVAASPPQRRPRRVLPPPTIAPSPAPFQMGLPALDAFPRKLWAGLVAREARATQPASLSYSDPTGHLGLREAISAYLGISRGVSCSPEQIFVTAGFQGALTLIARTLLRPGEAVWVEDPGYHMAIASLRASGARLVPVPVDAEGMCVEQAVSDTRGARLVLVTPSHQSPLGVALSLPRRLAMLAWAQAHSAWIVEDDYDGEFHYAGRPLPALKSLDDADVVLYAGSFSKVLFPGLRLGYLVVPLQLVPHFAAAVAAFSGGTGRLEQSVVARFMTEGHFAKHLKRMRSLYSARHSALANALSASFGDKATIAQQGGGMHLLLRLACGTSDSELVRHAESQGLAPAALSRHAISSHPAPTLLLSFTNIPEDDAARAAQALRQAIT